MLDENEFSFPFSLFISLFPDESFSWSYHYPDFEPSQGADMMKLSNPPAILCALLMASLDVSINDFKQGLKSGNR